MAIFYKENGKWYDAIESPSKVYGVRIKINDSRPNDAVEYIDDATGFTPMTRNSPGSWANNPLISGIKPVLRKSDGTWQDLNKRNLALDTSLTTIGNDVLTEVRTWWLSIESDNDYGYIRFANKKIDNTYSKIASTFKGKDVGCFHIGSYHNFHNNSIYAYSIQNQVPTNGTIAGINEACHNRGEGFDQFDWNTKTYLQALFIVLFKTLDGQSAIGKGLVSAGPTNETRTTYDNDYGMAGSTNSQEQMSFFWINNFWGNVRDYIAGAYIDGNGRLCVQTDEEPYNIHGSGYTTYNTTNFGSKKALPLKMDMQSTEVGFFPKQMGGSTTKGWCDMFYTGPNTVTDFGGCLLDKDNAGPFFSAFAYPFNASSYRHVGSRLVYRAGRPGVKPI